MVNPISLIMTLDEAVKWHQSLQINNKELVVTNGCFDILHRGHAEYLYAARQLGDALLILQNTDASVQKLKGSSRPIINEEDRAYLLASLRCVDAVVIFNDKRCTKAIEQLQPEIYVKGGDYTLETLNEEESAALQAAGTRCHFIPFVKNLSTSQIIQKVLMTQTDA